MSIGQLLRVCRSIPLSKLKQGGTLSIQSKFPNIRIHIKPEWRDDGLLSMTQFLRASDAEADLSITQEADKTTSMGRVESSICLYISPQEVLRTGSEVVARNDIESARTFVSDNMYSTGTDMVITDDGNIEPDSEEWHRPNVQRVDYTDGVTHVSTKTLLNETPCLILTVTVPEKLNLSCKLWEGGDIIIDKKLEGDIQLMTKDGNVLVSKLRGHDIAVSTQGSIVVSDLLEAQRINIDSQTRFRAKRIHGNIINVNVKRKQNDSVTTKLGTATEDGDDEGSIVDVSSLYVSSSGGAEIAVSSDETIDKRAVRIKSWHGHVTVQISTPPSANHPSVELGGVNGSFDVSIQHHPTKDTSEIGLAARVHVDSLSADSISVVSANSGDISLTLDRKVEADLRMLSSSDIVSFDARDHLFQHENEVQLIQSLKNLDAKSSATTLSKDASHIRIETDAFTARSTDETYQNIDYVNGWVDNQSNEPDSRHDLKAKGGKIRLDGAAEQSLHGFSSSPKGISRPLIVLATDGKIVLETLSWFGAIARRYGVEEARDDIGRTASRSGRPLVPIERE